MQSVISVFRARFPWCQKPKTVQHLAVASLGNRHSQAPPPPSRLTNLPAAIEQPAKSTQECHEADLSQLHHFTSQVAHFHGVLCPLPPNPYHLRSVSVFLCLCVSTPSLFGNDVRLFSSSPPHSSCLGHGCAVDHCLEI